MARLLRGPWLVVVCCALPVSAATLTLLNPTYGSSGDVSINGVVTASAGDTITKITWRWGDGSQNDSWFPASHKYLNNGQFTVQVTATSQAGETVSASAGVTVTSANNPSSASQNYTIYTVAGKGTAGYSGDNGPATAAELNQPMGVATDSAGNLYFADMVNNRICKVSGGVITTVAGNGTPGYSGDGGPATSAQLSSPYGVAVDSAGNLYIADEHNDRVRKVSNGVITTVAGNGLSDISLGDNGPATSAELHGPRGVALDGSGNLYIADTFHCRVRKVSGGVITTVAGGAFACSSSGDGGPATSANLDYFGGIAVDGGGNLYIAEANRIRKVSNGVITTVAGNGVEGFGGDGGPATNAQLWGPSAVAVDGAGNLYIADSGNHRIRKVSGGVITTVAGTGTQDYGGDGGPAASAMLSGPQGVAVGGAGSVYVADTYNNRVRVLAPAAGGGPHIQALGVVNAASYASPSPVAAGAIVSIFGLNMATGNAAATTLPLPTNLNGTQVLVNGIAAPLFFVSPGQINAQIPWEAGGANQVNVQVVLNGLPSTVEVVTLGTAAPGCFSMNQSGTGQGVVTIANTANLAAPAGSVPGARPALPGEYLSLYCTGLGAVTNQPASGAPASASPLSWNLTSPSVAIGDIIAPVSFYGLAPSFVGLNQINVQVPNNAPAGDAVAVVVGASGARSNTVMVAIGSAQARVSVSPGAVTLAPGATQQFAVNVAGTSNPAVTWSVNGVVGGNATVGTISATGLYTAPALVPNPNAVTVKATSVAVASAFGSAIVTISQASGQTWATTDSAGLASVSSGGVTIPVHLTDPQTGAPVAGVVVALGLPDSGTGAAVLALRDPQDRYPLQLIPLVTPGAAGMVQRGAGAAAESALVEVSPGLGCPSILPAIVTPRRPLGSTYVPLPEPPSPQDALFDAELNALQVLTRPLGVPFDFSDHDVQFTDASDCATQIWRLVWAEKGEIGTHLALHVIEKRTGLMLGPVSVLLMLPNLDRTVSELSRALNVCQSWVSGATMRVVQMGNEKLVSVLFKGVPTLGNFSTQNVKTQTPQGQPLPSSLCYVSERTLGNDYPGSTDATGNGTEWVPPDPWDVSASAPGRQPAIAHVDPPPAGQDFPPLTLPEPSDAAPNVVTVSPNPLPFQAEEGGPSPASKTLSIGSTPAPITWIAGVDAGWLRLASRTGNTPGTLSVGVDTSGLPAGDYNAAITIRGSGAKDVSIPVTLHIARQGGGGGLLYTYTGTFKKTDTEVIPATGNCTKDTGKYQVTAPAQIIVASDLSLGGSDGPLEHPGTFSGQLLANEGGTWTQTWSGNTCSGQPGNPPSQKTGTTSLMGFSIDGTSDGHVLTFSPDMQLFLCGLDSQFEYSSCTVSGTVSVLGPTVAATINVTYANASGNNSGGYTISLTEQ